MKVLMLLSKHFITDPRVRKEAETLRDKGNRVAVVVWDRKGDLKSKEIVNGITVVRIHNTLLMNLLPNNFFREFIWWRKAYKKGLELHKKGFDFEVVHCHDLDTLQAGVWLKKKIGCKLVYDAHEIFGYMSMPKLMEKMSFLLEKILVKNVDYIITAYDPIKNYLRSITDKPITTILNCKDLINKEYKPPENNVFTICYIGLFSKARMFPQLVDIIGNIENVKFVIAGKKEGSLYEEVEERCKKYDNVEFLGTIPHSKVIQKTLESNAIICIFNPKSKIHQVGLPNKLFEAMATGRPLIATKNMYYSNEFIEKEKCGLSVANNVQEIRDAIITLRDNPQLCEELGRNGLKAAKEKYNWGNEAKKLDEIYRGLK